MVHTLRSQLATLPEIATLAHHLSSDQHSPQRLRVAPIPNAARIPYLAAFAHHLAMQQQATDTPQCQVLLYVVATAEQATRGYEDLCQWLSVDQVLQYPCSDSLLYERIAPDMGVHGRRLQVVQRLASLAPSPNPLVIIAPVRGLLQPMLTPQELAQASTPIAIGDMNPQDTLIRQWIDRGYRVTAKVEEHGEMSRRGGIVDIWGGADTLPLRIEWFGDEIDSMRRFDPVTQRSEQYLDAALVGPPMDIPFWQYKQVLDYLAAQPVKKLRPEVREEWEHSLSRLELGGRFEGWVRLSPFFHQAPNQAPNQEHGQQPAPSSQRSLLAHLPVGSVVFFNDVPLLQQTANAHHDDAEEQRTTLISTGELLPIYPRPYLLWDELWQPSDPLPHMAQIPQVDLSTNDLSEDTGGDGGCPQGQDTVLPAPTFSPADLFGSQVRRLVRHVLAQVGRGEHVVLVTTQVARFQEMIEEASQGRGGTTASDPLLPSVGEGAGDGGYPKGQGVGASGEQDGSVSCVHGTLTEGWHQPDLALTLYTDTEIFGWTHRRTQASRRRKTPKTDNDRTAFLQGLQTGEYVVHIEHGIAIYDGLIRRSVGGIEREYLDLRFANDDRLYVPVDQVDRIARYVGAGDATPRLSRLGTQEWERAKRKARDAVQDMASELLDLYAHRRLSQGYAFAPDNDWQHQLETQFPYVETADQLRATAEVKEDMESTYPMDRLVCGDVGFGKTEVALRAAFKAVQESKQVAILVPTTVLAQQHYETFSRRMEPFAVKVEVLSRFRKPKQQEMILQKLRHGEVDVIVGTHRLLSNDVFFHDLGLLIIDEEQRFGVRHKERIKQLRTDVDVLTLTATPIPRTLHMALAGIRDMSVIETPPEDRMPIKTYVVPTSKALVRDVIRRELDRGGQVYYVHNRVRSIYHVVDRLRQLLPEARIGVGHGQMDESELEQVMLEFYRGNYDVLVCTTIIENGLDVPTVNTIIIDDAPMYGLAQLYQLRGRVGRSARRAYAYLLYQKNQYMTGEAAQRLQAIQDATDLGAGFRIAMRDLEIRGAGNMLGKEQSGYIAAVGFDLYSRLLEQAVKQLKKQAKLPTRPDTQTPATPAPPQGDSPVPPTPAHPQGKDDVQPLVIDEKVLLSPLVTLTLPVSAYLPDEYIRDEAVRLEIYQRMNQVATVEGVQELRRELRDRFGEVPEPAANLLMWLQVKLLAMRAHIHAITTTDDAILIRLPAGGRGREQLRQRFGRDKSVNVGGQFVRLERGKLHDAWADKLLRVLDALGG